MRRGVFVAGDRCGAFDKLGARVFRRDRERIGHARGRSEIAYVEWCAWEARVALEQQGVEDLPIVCVFIDWIVGVEVSDESTEVVGEEISTSDNPIVGRPVSTP